MQASPSSPQQRQDETAERVEPRTIPATVPRNASSRLRGRVTDDETSSTSLLSYTKFYQLNEGDDITQEMRELQNAHQQWMTSYRLSINTEAVAADKTKEELFAWWATCEHAQKTYIAASKVDNGTPVSRLWADAKDDICATLDIQDKNEPQKYRQCYVDMVQWLGSDDADVIEVVHACPNKTRMRSLIAHFRKHTQTVPTKQQMLDWI